MAALVVVVVGYLLFLGLMEAMGRAHENGKRHR